MWSWVLEGIGLTGAFVVGRKHWWGWCILLVNTVLWGVYAITSHQYGFVVASFFYAPLYSRNLFKWYRHRKRTITMTPDRRTNELCDHAIDAMGLETSGVVYELASGGEELLTDRFAFCPFCGEKL